LNNYNHIFVHLPVWAATWVVALWLHGFLSVITYAPLVSSEQGMDLLKSLYPVILSRDPWSSHIVEMLDEECHGLVLQVKKEWSINLVQHSSPIAKSY